MKESSSHNKVEAGKQTELFKIRRREMPDAERMQSIQDKLYQKAKQEKAYKFYVLYDKLFLPYVLRMAWHRVKSNDGSPGIDGQRIEDVEAYGVEKYLTELGEDLRKQTYQPQAVKRVMIEKADGGERPLGIPTVRDRIAQSACKLILEPIFEADFKDSSHGFRPGRSSKDAMESIHQNLKEDRTEVLDADLSKYFNSIPHDKLMIALSERIADPRILKLIRKWLKVPVFENGKLTGGKRNNRGTPQGGVISPLLANIYLHLLDRIIENPLSLFGRYGIRLIRYADDFVLMGKRIPDQIIETLTSLLNRMGLALNEGKTRRVEARHERFNFLGFTVQYSPDLKGRTKYYWNITPSKKSEQKLIGNVRDYLDTHGHYKAQQVAQDLNVKLRGWLNYFEIKGVSYTAMSKRKIRRYLSDKLHRYYNRKSQRKSRLYGQKAFEVLVSKYKLIDPTKYSFQTTRL